MGKCVYFCSSKEQMTDSPLTGAVTIIRTKVEAPPIMKQEGVETFPMLESFFRVENPSQKQREQMKEVQDFIAREGDDEAKQLSVLRDIRYRLAEGDLFTIHKYIKLRNMSKSYETQAKALENA